MAVLRTDIERALDELASQEEGMRFQGLAVVLGKKRWPELIARQRKKDFGLDAYAPASLTPEKIGKGLAASITPTLKKISADAKTAKENFPDLKMLLFVTSAKVGNADRKQWEEAILRQDPHPQTRRSHAQCLFSGCSRAPPFDLAVPGEGIRAGGRERIGP